jgi:hypothetical protein
MKRFTTDSGCTVQVRTLEWDKTKRVLSLTMEQEDDGRHAEVLLSDQERAWLRTLLED